MLESSLYSPIMYPLSSTSTYPSIHFSSSTCTLHWGKAPSLPLFLTYLPCFHLPFIILFHLWSWLSRSFHPSICTFHVPFMLSIHFPTYIHNPSIYLILTCYPYLAFHNPRHVHPSSIHTPTFILLSYVLDLGCPFHFLHFISYTSSIPSISLPLFFHTLPPISLIHSTVIPMLVIIIRGTIS